MWLKGCNTFPHWCCCVRYRRNFKSFSKSIVTKLCLCECPAIHIPVYLTVECEPCCLSVFLEEKKDATCGSHVRGEQNSRLLCFEACLECIFISCPRTPTAPICSPALLSSSTAASCVVTALCFILSAAVTLCSPGISVSCSLVSSLKNTYTNFLVFHLDFGLL